MTDFNRVYVHQTPKQLVHNEFSVHLPELNLVNPLVEIVLIVLHDNIQILFLTFSCYFLLGVVGLDNVHHEVVLQNAEDFELSVFELFILKDLLYCYCFPVQFSTKNLPKSTLAYLL